MKTLTTDELTELFLEERRLSESKSSSGNTSRDEEALVKHALGLPQEVRSYDLTDALVAVVRLARDPNTHYDSYELEIVRERGYDWRRGAQLRKASLTPATAVFFDAYVRLKEVTSELNTRLAALDKRVFAEDYARQEVVERIRGAQ